MSPLLLFSPLGERVLASGLVLAVSSTVLLGMAWLLTARLRPLPAATRFAIWMGATAGLLVVASARTVLPARPIAFDWWPAWSRDAGGVTTTSASQSRDATGTLTITMQASRDGLGRVVTERANTTPSSPSAGRGASASASVSRANDAPARPRLASGELLALAALLVWGAGSLYLAARLVRGTWQVRALVRRSPRIVEGRYWTLVQQVADRMGVERAVALRWVDHEQIPVTTGIVHPVILLPQVAQQWPEARLRLVLQHEMAHIARADVALMTLAQVALVLCWWQPLLWRALRGMELERERACDDLVLTSGVPAVDYADELLQLVRALRTPGPAAFAALGMAHGTDTPSQVEARLRAVLDPGVARRRTPRAVLWLVALVVLAVAPVGRLMPRALGGGSSSRTAAAQAITPGSAMSPASASSHTSAGDARTTAAERDPLANVPDPSDDFQFGDPCTTRVGSVSISRSVDDSIQRYQRVDPAGCLRMHLVGRPEFDGNDVPVRLRGDDVRLVIEEVRGGHSRRVRLQLDAGALRPTYVEDGVTVVDSDRAAMTAAAAWARALYLQIARDVGLGVETRVPRLLRLGGADSLSRELRAIRADDVAERYLTSALAMPARSDERAAIEALAESYAARTGMAARRRMEAAIAKARSGVEAPR